MKYNVTNVSAGSAGGARSVFLTEAGRLLRPGQSAPCNRLDKGTQVLVDAGVLQIQEGDYPPIPLFKDTPKPVEEDETPTGPRPADVAARKEFTEAVDKRLADAAKQDDPKPAADRSPETTQVGKGKGKETGLKPVAKEPAKSDDGAVKFTDVPDRDKGSN